MLNSYYNLPPELPIERLDSLATSGCVYLDDNERGFIACRHAKEGDEMDYISLSYSPDGSRYGSTQLCLTPAMLVHLANMVLTDGERAAILAPEIAGAVTE